MDPTVALLIILAAAIVGVALGWYLGHRPAEAYRKERDERLDDFRRAITDWEMARYFEII